MNLTTNRLSSGRSEWTRGCPLQVAARGLAGLAGVWNARRRMWAR